MQRKLILAVVVCLALIVRAIAAAEAPEQIGPYLQRITVTIKKGSDRGSGTVVTRPVEGKSVNWILTAAHVVRDLREVKDVIAPDGTERKEVRYRDSEVLQELNQDGRTVGEIKLDAKVINVDSRRDIALLRVRKSDFLAVSARFYLDDSPPSVGTPVLHCGSPGGQAIGAASVTSGVISRTGVRIEEYGGTEGIYDQVDCAALGGSSGGMVCLRADGRYVGMVTLGLRGGDSFHWMVPVRTIRDWAEELGAEWLLDGEAKPPTEEDVAKIPLELASPGLQHTDATSEPCEAVGSPQIIRAVRVH
jgi:S1-C subfamily serine protease